MTLKGIIAKTHGKPASECFESLITKLTDIQSSLPSEYYKLGIPQARAYCTRYHLRPPRVTR